MPLSVLVPRKIWNLRNVTGYCVDEKQGAKGFNTYDYFIWMFPMGHLRNIKFLGITGFNVPKLFSWSD